MSWALATFLVLSAIMIFSALQVVTSEVVIHAVLHLALVFVSMAGMYLLLNAEFLAAVQILVYAGAVMTVIIFTVMLSEMDEIIGPSGPRTITERIKDRLMSRYWGPLPLVVAGGVTLTVLVAIYRAGWDLATNPVITDTTETIGSAMFSKFVIPFEVASVLLLVALVGAIALAKKEEAE